MKYNVTLDLRGYVLSITHTGTIKDYVELNLDDYDLTEGRLNAYRLGKNALIFDEEEYGRILAEKQSKADQEEIADLEEKLNETDYIMARFIEEVMALDNKLTWIVDFIKLSTEYRQKYKEAIANRKKWRERIEELRNENE